MRKKNLNVYYRQWWSMDCSAPRQRPALVCLLLLWAASRWSICSERSNNSPNLIFIGEYQKAINWTPPPPHPTPWVLQRKKIQLSCWICWALYLSFLFFWLWKIKALVHQEFYMDTHADNCSSLAKSTQVNSKLVNFRIPWTSSHGFYACQANAFQSLHNSDIIQKSCPDCTTRALCLNVLQTHYSGY